MSLFCFLLFFHLTPISSFLYLLSNQNNLLNCGFHNNFSFPNCLQLIFIFPSSKQSDPHIELYLKSSLAFSVITSTTNAYNNYTTTLKLGVYISSLETLLITLIQILSLTFTTWNILIITFTMLHGYFSFSTISPSSFSKLRQTSHNIYKPLQIIVSTSTNK